MRVADKRRSKLTSDRILIRSSTDWQTYLFHLSLSKANKYLEWPVTDF